jgi:multiple sugar transport system permease protein
MDVTLKKQADAPHEAKQKTTGVILVGVGVLLAVIGVILLRWLRTGSSPNSLVNNLAPLVAFAGIVLIGQGILVLRLRGRRLTAWFMALPGVTYILVIVIFPLLYAIWISFLNWNIQSPARSFIFLQNYGTVLTTPRVWGALGNTTYIVIVAVAVEFILGIGLALLLAERFPGRAIVLSVIMIPLMMAPIVVGQTWRMLWDTRFGAVNHFLSIISGQSVQLVWLSNPKLAFPAIIITDIWQWTPFIFLITLAGLLAVNVELYEAAAIDGAASWQMFWRITLPVIRPVLLVALLFRLIDALKIFDIIFILTNGGPGYSTETVPFYLFQQGFTYGRFGYTAAASFLFLILVVVITTVLIRRIGEL